MCATACAANLVLANVADRRAETGFKGGWLASLGTTRLAQELPEQPGPNLRMVLWSAWAGLKQWHLIFPAYVWAMPSRYQTVMRMQVKASIG